MHAGTAKGKNRSSCVYNKDMLVSVDVVELLYN